MYEPRNDEQSVRHLVALGYVDPDAIAAREAAVRRQLEAEFQDAAKLYERGEFEEAARRLEQLSADDPNWTAPRQLRAEVYYRTGRLAEAQQQLDWLTEHGVERPRLALIAGALALARRELTVALEALEYAAYAEPELPSVFTLLGMVLLRQRRWEEAQTAFAKAIEHNPADVIACDGIATICLYHGEFEETANYSLEALEHDMHFFRAHYHLGIALLHLSRPQESIAALETAAKINTNSAAPFYQLSLVAKNQLADPVRAAEYRNQCREVVRRRSGRSRSD